VGSGNAPAASRWSAQRLAVPVADRRPSTLLRRSDAIRTAATRPPPGDGIDAAASGALMPNLGTLIAQFESLMRARPASSVSGLRARAARSTLEFRSELLRLAPPLSRADSSAAPAPRRPAPTHAWEPVAAAPAGTAISLESAHFQTGAVSAYRGRSPARGAPQSAPRTPSAAAEAQQPLAAPGAPAGPASSAGAGAGASAATPALLAVFLLCLLAALLPARLALDPSPLRSILLSWRLERPG
jgi:hypothetical protein